MLDLNIFFVSFSVKWLLHFSNKNAQQENFLANQSWYRVVATEILDTMKILKVCRAMKSRVVEQL